MGKFRNLFKVRQPGNGSAVQKQIADQRKDRITITDKGKSVPNGGEKKSI